MSSPDVENPGDVWASQYVRRVELIQQGVHGELTSIEQAELDRLQLLLDHRFETFDQGLRDAMAEMRAVANA